MVNNNENLKKASEIFSELLKHKGKIVRDKNTSIYFVWYADPDVKDYLEVLLESNELKIFQQNDTLYMYALEQSPFAIKESDIKSSSRFPNNKYVYLSNIIFFVFLSEIYSGDGQMKIIRESISVEQLQKSVTDFLTKTTISEEEEINYGVNFRTSAEIWEPMLNENPDSNAAGTKSKLQFIKLSMQYYSSDAANLVNYNSELETYSPTIKLKDFISHGELNVERFNELLSLKERGE